MSINLQRLLDTAEAFELPVINVLKTTLEYEADTSLVAAKLASDIRFICEAEVRKVNTRSEGSQQGIPGILFTVWMLVIDLARCIPADHPWQDRLLQALETLRRSDEIVPEGLHPWSELPDLDLYLLDRWNVNQDPTRDDEISEEEWEQWKNQNSFTARLNASLPSPWTTFPIWQLREALEEPLSETKFEADALLWIACEWMLRCPQSIFDSIHPDTQEESPATAPGSLYEDGVSQWGEPRWKFWKARFETLAADGERLNLDESLLKRLQEAVKTMEVAEQRSKATASLSSGP